MDPTAEEPKSLPTLIPPMSRGVGHEDNETELQKEIAGSLGIATEKVRPVTSDSDIIRQITGEDIETMINPDNTEVNQKPKVANTEPEEDDGTLSNTRELAGQYFTTSTPPPRTAPNEIGSELEADRKAKMEEK
jgi:hypothetical protein